MNISNCIVKDLQSHNFKRSWRGFFFVLIVTPLYMKDYLHQVNSLKLFCDLHGYTLLIIDPDPILHRLYTPTTEFNMVLAPSVMRDIFQDLYRSKGCDVNWVVFLDIDIFVIDYERKIESFIHYANNHAGKKRRCKIIAQDSLTSLNTGFNYIICMIRSVNDKIVYK